MIDLQSHSTVSDGQLEPGDVARAAAEAGVTVMSLTDHDGVAGVEEATRVADRARDRERARRPRCRACTSTPRTSTSAATGSTWRRSPRPAPRPSRSASTAPRRSSPTSTRHGVEVTFEEAVAKAGAADAIGRPHIAKAAGAGPDLGPFFEEYLVPGAKAFVSRKWPTRRAGGRDHPRRRRVAVVAHPYWDVQDPEQVRDLVESLVRDVGLDGIETFYPPHTAEQTKHCLELCEEFGLVPTASSDFHGPTHKTFSRWGAYDTYGLGEPQVPPKP